LRSGDAIDLPDFGVSCRSMRALLPFAVLSFALPALAQEQRPAAFVDAASVVPGLVVEMRYLGDNNFVGRPIDGYQRPVCLLTRKAAAALAEIARDLQPRGFKLKVFDCYRPRRAVAHFLRWAQAIGDVARKPMFYPDLDKRELFTEGYLSSRSGHSRGSAVDLTIVNEAGSELDMGTPFDFFGPRSWPSDKRVSARARANRALLASAMRRHGFSSHSKEWWHFTLRDEPFPRSYFDFPVR
jgi:zinc D-Ala-D-Ala dipeptidase